MSAPITIEEIEAARTPAGGWTKAQLAQWGVPWPPPKGWIKRLLAAGPVVAAPFTPEQEARLREIAQEEAEAALARSYERIMRLYDRDGVVGSGAEVPHG